jgi:hypothetical protein
MYESKLIGTSNYGELMMFAIGRLLHFSFEIQDQMVCIEYVTGSRDLFAKIYLMLRKIEVLPCLHQLHQKHENRIYTALLQVLEQGIAPNPAIDPSHWNFFHYVKLVICSGDLEAIANMFWSFSKNWKSHSPHLVIKVIMAYHYLERLTTNMNTAVHAVVDIISRFFAGGMNGELKMHQSDFDAIHSAKMVTDYTFPAQVQPPRDYSNVNLSDDEDNCESFKRSRSETDMDIDRLKRVKPNPKPTIGPDHGNAVGQKRARQ